MLILSCISVASVLYCFLLPPSVILKCTKVSLGYFQSLVTTFWEPPLAFGMYWQRRWLCFLFSKPGSPAKNAGIEEGDYIFSVNGTDVHDCEHQKVVQMIAASGRIVR